MERGEERGGSWEMVEGEGGGSHKTQRHGRSALPVRTLGAQLVGGHGRRDTVVKQLIDLDVLFLVVGRNIGEDVESIVRVTRGRCNTTRPRQGEE